MTKIVDFIKKCFKTLADCVTPVVPVLLGAGMLKVLLIIIGPDVFNILQSDSSTYMVLSFIADAGYYFLPIFVAVSSTEIFKTNKYIAALLGAMLISPDFIEYISQGTALTIFKLPIASTSYENQMLPSVIIVFIYSYINKVLNKIVPEKINGIFVPMLSILIMAPIAFCLVGPLGVFLCDCLTGFVLWLSEIGPLGNAIFTAILPLVIMFGLGGADLTAMLAMISVGPDPICFFSNVIYNSVLGATALSVYARDKKADSLAASIAACIGGASEPAIFGILINDSKALVSSMAGGFVAGLLSGIFKIKTFAMASFGLVGIVATIGPDSSLLLAALSILIGSIVSFVLYLLFTKTVTKRG